MRRPVKIKSAMSLLDRFKNFTTGTPLRTLVSSLTIALLVPITLFATAQNLEIRRRAAEETFLPKAELASTLEDLSSKYVGGEVLVKFKSDPLISGAGKTVFPSINTVLEEFENPLLSPISLTKGSQSTAVKTAKEKFGLERIYKITLSEDKVQSLLEKYNNRLKLEFPEDQPLVAGEEIDEFDITKLLVIKLSEDPNVEYAEINGLYYPTTIFPDDTLFSQQWSLHNTGQTGGKVDADVDAPEAWQEITGNSQVIAAVLDSGVMYNHEDLADNILKDSSGNVVGYDFANNDTDPMDDQAHGTHVAGTIAAVSNNGLGVSGICWNCKIIPIRFIGDDGRGTTEHAIQGIEFAMENGARLINNSWGGGPFSQALIDVINAANDAGVLIIASSGNDNMNMREFYPASYDNVISVGSTDENDQRSWFSNHGLELDLSAPGEGILSTFIPGHILGTGCEDPDGDGYGLCGGTSMAAPHVSGVAALILSQNPTMSLDELKRRLLFGVDDNGDSGWDEYFGLGRINAYEAAATPSASRVQALITNPTENKVISHRPIQVKGYTFADNFASFKVEVGVGESPTSWQTTGLTIADGGYREVFGDKLADFNPQELPYGPLTLKLTVFSQSGATSESRRTINYMPERIIYIDDDNETGIEDGSREHPFNTIQEGVDDANPLDTVKVLSGVYEESVRLGKSEVYLSGEDPFTTIISGAGEVSGIRSSVYPDTHVDFLIENFTIRGFERGIIISGPAQNGMIRNNIIEDVAVRDDRGYGIQLDHFDTGIKVVGNFTVGGRNGIFQNGFGNSSNSFEFNYSAGATYGGISVIHFGENINLTDNVVVSNTIVGLAPFACLNNTTISGNHMENNMTGLLAAFCPGDVGNEVFRNNFVGNSGYQTYVSPDVRDLGWSREGEGNHWSNYDETQEGAFDEDGNGIADSPYQIDANNTDEFPFMKENGWQRSDLTIYPTRVLAGTMISISGGVLGDFNEENKVLLNRGEDLKTEAEIIRWDNSKIIARLPEKMLPGRYSASLLISSQNGLPTNTGLVLTVFHSEEFVPAGVCIPESLLPGDLDCDCEVDIFDLVRIARIYGAEAGDENYDPNLDLVQHEFSQGKINLFDLVYVATKYGDTCPP